MESGVVGTDSGLVVAQDPVAPAKLGSEDADPRPAILLSFPVFQSVYAQPFGNFMAIALHAASKLAPRYRLDLKVSERELIHSAMNRVCEIALEHKHEAVIVFDDDCFPPLDVIPRLLRYLEEGYDFVAGAGFMRNYPHTTTVGKTFKEGVSAVLRDDQVEWAAFEWLDDITALQPLQEVDFCGLPVAMIRRTILEKVPAPWFGTHINNGDCTHDAYFALKAKHHGFRLFVDTTIQCGHLSAAPIITFDNRDRVREAAKLFKT